MGEPGPDCDWKVWHRFSGGFQRPSNELLFIRQVGVPARQLEVDGRPLMEDFPELLRRPDTESFLARSREEYRREARTVDGILLQAVASLVAELKTRLELNFRVAMTNDIFTEFEESGPETESVRRHRLVSWTIENIEERTRRSELEEIEQFATNTGFSREEFATVVIASRRNKRESQSGMNPKETSERRKL